MLNPQTAVDDWQGAVGRFGSRLSKKQPEVQTATSHLQRYADAADRGDLKESKLALADLTFHLKTWLRREGELPDAARELLMSATLETARSCS